MKVKVSQNKRKKVSLMVRKVVKLRDLLVLYKNNKVVIMIMMIKYLILILTM